MSAKEVNMGNKRHYSVSRIGAWMTCPMRYKYQYVEDIHPVREHESLSMGKLLHEAMAVGMSRLADGLDKEHAYIDAVKRITCDDVELETTARAVFAYAWDGFNVEDYDVAVVMQDGKPKHALELEFNVRLPGGMVYADVQDDELHGFIDAILIEKATGNAYVVDYKFRKRFADIDDDMINIQNMVYAYACRQMGIEVAGTMLWECRNYPMTMPKLNKDGTLSKAKISCTWDAYASYAIQLGLNPLEYSDEMEPKLKDVEWTRISVDYTPAEAIDRAIKKVVIPAIRDIKGGKAYMHMNYWTCMNCAYKPLCSGNLRGYDVEAWIGDEGEDKMFVRRTRDE